MKMDNGVLDQYAKVKKLHEVCARERLWDCFSYCVCMVNPRWWFSILSLILEVGCTNQRPYFVRDWLVRWRQQITLGETVRYMCISGYKSTDGSNLAKCTRDGWRPDPLCKGILKWTLFYDIVVTVLYLFLKVGKELLVHYQKVPGMKSVTKNLFCTTYSNFSILLIWPGPSLWLQQFLFVFCMFVDHSKEAVARPSNLSL